MDQITGSIILFVTVLLIGSITIFVKDFLKKYFDLLLTISGAFLMAISFLHLIPETFRATTYTNLGVFILIGFLAQLSLDFLSKGVEHGHVHKQNSYAAIISVLLGLGVHSFIEGIPLGYGEHNIHQHTHDHLFWAIVLHKIPAAIALTLLLVISDLSKKKVFLFLLIFASCTPLGSLLGNYISSSFSKIEPFVTAIIIGSLLHISTTILFEIDKGGHHNFSIKKLIAIVIGFSAAMMTMH